MSDTLTIFKVYGTNALAKIVVAYVEADSPQRAKAVAYQHVPAFSDIDMVAPWEQYDVPAPHTVIQDNEVKERFR